jgi:Na+-translocating ferredoxin:NAD+ oxidoreductase RnfG subunit
MNKKQQLWLLLIPLLASFAVVTSALAHITPPVVLMSDRDAVVALTAGARRFFVRETKLTNNELTTLQKQWGWRPEEAFYRFYLGRDDQGRLVSAVAFLTEYTIHGPVRVAVAIGSDGKVKGALVVELTEETYPWLKPLIDQDFTQEYVGRESKASFALGEKYQKALGSMPLFYAQIVASLIQRGTILYEATIAKQVVSP